MRGTRKLKHTIDPPPRDGKGRILPASKTRDFRSTPEIVATPEAQAKPAQRGGKIPARRKTPPPE